MRPSRLRALAFLASIVPGGGLTGCSDDPPPPPDPIAALDRVTATLQEAGRLDRAGQDEDARASWRRAHAEFEEAVEPALRAHMSDVEVATVEIGFGLMRAAIDRRRGTARRETAALVASLEAARAVLAAAPPPDGEGG